MPPPHALQVLRRHALVMCAVMAPSAVPAKHPMDYQGIAARLEDPHVLAEIAKQAGMEAGKAMQDELGAMSAKMMTKMDEISDSVKGKIAYDKAPMFPCCSILT